MNVSRFFSAENKRLTFILLTMFLNALGFSIIIPIIPFLVERYITGLNAIALSVGLMVSIYAFCQFFAAPGLGALADKFGRRPILLVSLFGSAIGYIFLGVGGALWVLYLGRIIDGLTGGNISTMYAYVADITKPQDRGKYFGQLGAAWGFGFMIGPALAALLAHVSLTLPLFLAAAITLGNMTWGYFVLPESLSKEHELQHIDLTHLNPFSQFGHVLSLPILRRLFLSGAFFFFAINALYGNSSVFLKDVMHWGATQIGLFLFIVGILDIVTQGFLVPKLLQKFNSTTVAIIGLIITAVGYTFGALTALNASLVFLGISMILNVGDGLFEPTFSSILANAVGLHMQGRIQGANQGLQSVVRIFGPLFAAWVYIYWRGLPYLTEAILCLVALVVLVYALPTIRSHKVA